MSHLLPVLGRRAVPTDVVLTRLPVPAGTTVCRALRRRSKRIPHIAHCYDVPRRHSHSFSAAASAGTVRTALLGHFAASSRMLHLLPLLQVAGAVHAAAVLHCYPFRGRPLVRVFPTGTRDHRRTCSVQEPYGTRSSRPHPLRSASASSRNSACIRIRSRPVRLFRCRTAAGAALVVAALSTAGAPVRPIMLTVRRRSRWCCTCSRSSVDHNPRTYWLAPPAGAVQLPQLRGVSTAVRNLTTLPGSQMARGAPAHVGGAAAAAGLGGGAVAAVAGLHAADVDGAAVLAELLAGHGHAGAAVVGAAGGAGGAVAVVAAVAADLAGVAAGDAVALAPVGRQVAVGVGAAAVVVAAAVAALETGAAADDGADVAAAAAGAGAAVAADRRWSTHWPLPRLAAPCSRPCGQASAQQTLLMQRLEAHPPRPRRARRSPWGWRRSCRPCR